MKAAASASSATDARVRGAAASRARDGEVHGRGAVRPARRRFTPTRTGGYPALAFILPTSAGLVPQSSRTPTATPLGFQPEGVTTIALPLPAAKYTNDTLIASTVSQIVDRVRTVPGVRAAAAAGTLPIGGRFNTDGYVVEGQAPPTTTGMETQTVQLAVGPEYFHTLGIPVLYGRDFDARDRAGALPVTILDEELASRYWRGADALGHRVRLTGGPTWPAIGGGAWAGADAEARRAPGHGRGHRVQERLGRRGPRAARDEQGSGTAADHRAHLLRGAGMRDPDEIRAELGAERLHFLRDPVEELVDPLEQRRRLRSARLAHAVDAADHPACFLEAGQPFRRVLSRPVLELQQP